jgi:guanine nucleotide-binding protein subunit alpha
LPAQNHCFHYLLLSCLALIVEIFGWPTDCCHVQQYINLILIDHDLGPKDSMPLQYLPCFKSLWVDAGVQKAIEKGNEFALHDNLN